MKTKPSVFGQLLLLSALLTGCQSSQPVSQSPSQPVGDTLQTRALLTASRTELSESQAAQLAGQQPVLLVFWQEWCGSCVAEAPQVQKAHERYGAQLAVFGVVSGEKSKSDELKLTRLIGELGLTYPQIYDRDASFARHFDVQGTPDVVLLDSERAVVYRGHHLPPSVALYLGADDPPQTSR